MNWSASDIDRLHRSRGWAKIGYHYVIRLDGELQRGRLDADIGAHASGFNRHSIGICLIGGLNEQGAPEDNYTPAQRTMLRALLTVMRNVYPNAIFCGHRDLSPDKNDNGVIERDEWLKECPCFNVAEWCRLAGIQVAPT